MENDSANRIISEIHRLAGEISRKNSEFYSNPKLKGEKRRDFLKQKTGALILQNPPKDI